MRKLAIAAMAMLLAGCVSSGTRVSESQISQFEKGKTTYSDVVAKLGPPNGVTHSSNGTTVITYVFVSSSPNAAAFIPIVGAFASGATGESTAAFFFFGPDNILSSYASSASHTTTGMSAAAAPKQTASP